MECNTGELVGRHDMSQKTIAALTAFHDGLAQAVSREEQMRLLQRAAPFAPVDESDVAKLKDIPLVARKNWMRNRPCPCRSGKKFKKCCWSKMETKNNDQNGLAKTDEERLQAPIA